MQRWKSSFLPTPPELAGLTERRPAVLNCASVLIPLESKVFAFARLSDTEASLPTLGLSPHIVPKIFVLLVIDATLRALLLPFIRTIL